MTVSASSSHKWKQVKLRSRGEAVDYFKKNQRIRGRDLQMARTQTLSWNCEGTRLAVGCEDKRVCVVNVEGSGRMSCDFTGSAHDGSVDQVAFQQSSPHLFASASSDKSICIWDIRQAKKHTRLTTKVANMYVTWSPCGRFLVYGDKDDKIHVVDERRLGETLKTHDMKRESCEFVYHPSGKFLFVATAYGKIEVFSMPDMEPVRTIQAHSPQSVLHAMSITKDGSRIAVGGNDAMCSIWNLDDMLCESSLPRMDYPVRTLSFSGDGQLLATGSEDHHIDIAWVEDGQKICDVPVDAETYCLAWNPKQLILAYVGSSADVRNRDDVRIFGLSG